MRFAHTQVCPALRYFDAIAPSTAASISASSKTMNGALPPSSSEIRLIVPEHCFIRMRPTSVEPVNESFLTSSLSHISRPMPFESRDVITLKIPFGTPASSANATCASADSGVSPAGLIIIAQPTASAGAAFRAIIEVGKFHGVIAAHTPTGCLITLMREFGNVLGIVSP